MKKLFVLFCFLLPSFALAHPGHGGPEDFTDGFFHPLFGLDHLLAALAVGIWAARAARSSSARLALFPAAFLAGVSIGAAQGFAGYALPGYDLGVWLSVGLLGLALWSPAADRTGALPLVLFGWLHGNAHGAEWSAPVGALPFAAGFLLATLSLHLLGIAAASSLRKYGSPRAAETFGRATGAACLALSAVLWLR